MPLTVLDLATVASGAENEDRIGTRGALAWVIDGATDIGSEPIIGPGSDAGWFAGAIHDVLDDPGFDIGPRLADLPSRLAATIAARFEMAQRRAPADRFEHPSASGVVVRMAGATLDYVSVGDCTLIVEQNGTVARIGSDLADAGDKRLAAAIARFHDDNGGASAAAARAHVWPAMRAARNRMNTPGGYGILSITPPPDEFVRAGQVDLASDARILLASDGLMRLVDVFHAYDDGSLLRAAERHGLAALCHELRAFEHGDPETRVHPRAKTCDDASGLLLAVR